MKTKQLVESIFSQPTAPFREAWVLERIQSILARYKIPYFVDRRGNLVAGVGRARQLRGNKKVAFLAHTDHPGFHIKKVVNKSKKKYQALWFGGAPFKHMRGARVRVFDPRRVNWSQTGKITWIHRGKYNRQGIPFHISFDRDQLLDSYCFGAFDFPGVRIRGDRIHSRAADDLAGVVIALGALIDNQKSNYKGRTIGIFTRAEEVGFVGCIEMLQSKLLPKNLWTVSLEASKALPGALIGQGPVLRLGDRSTLFNSTFSLLMWHTAEKLKRQRRSFKYQRRLMDGGSCEATALSLYDITTSGLAVPLLNYHNQGKSRPAAECISLSDVDSGRLLASELVKNVCRQPNFEKKFKKRLVKNYKRLEPLLKQQIPFVSNFSGS